MPRGYEDDYGRRDAPHRREARDDRHVRDRVETRDRTRIIEESREIPRGSRIDPMEVVDTRMSAAAPRGLGDPRGANAAARLEPRVDRHGGAIIDTRIREQPAYYEDPRTGRLVEVRPEQQAREPVARYPNPRDDRMDTDMDMHPRRQPGREVVESRDPMEDSHRSSKYNDYFVPGAGIDREVIQHEICRYLGNDATVRPYTNKDGRTGFLVRAYRALTSAMIEDLKKDSARWRQDQERKSRQGRSTGSYANYAETQVQMKGRHDTDFGPIKGRHDNDFGDTMEVDDYSFDPPPSRHRDVDPRMETRDPREIRDLRDSRDSRDARESREARDSRDPRDMRDGRDPRVSSGRHGAEPISSSGYGQETYPAYAIGPNQTGAYPPESVPRYGGNSTPPSSRPPMPGYSQPGYTGRTSTAPPPAQQVYRDPRTGQIISSGYDGGYGDTGRRHR